MGKRSWSLVLSLQWWGDSPEKGNALVLVTLPVITSAYCENASKRRLKTLPEFGGQGILGAGDLTLLMGEGSESNSLVLWVSSLSTG